MVAVAIIAALVNRIAVLVYGRPLANSVALVSTYSPVLPKVALLHVGVIRRVIGKVKGDVVMEASQDVVGIVAGGIARQKQRVVSPTDHELGLV